MAKKSPPLRDEPAEPSFLECGLAVLESHHSSRFSMSWRIDPFPKVLVTIGGSGELHVLRTRYQLSPGTLIVLPAGIRHRLQDCSGNPLSVFVLCWESNAFAGGGVVGLGFSEVKIFKDAALVEKAVAVLRQILFEDKCRTPESVAMQISLGTGLLVSIIRAGRHAVAQAPSSSQRVRAYVKELDRSFWNREPMDGAARRLGMSRRRFSGLFRELTGKSWLEYVHELRTAHGAYLLGETDNPVKSIAFQCGYDDLSHFYRRFSERYGTSPAKWRSRRGIP